MDEQIVKLLLDDRKRDRRWRNIRFFIMAFFTLLFIILVFAPSGGRLRAGPIKKPYVALIRLNGTISDRTSFSARKVIPLLNKAFADKKAKGVILVINSPGGSAVQASIIHDKIEQLKKKYKKKVVVLGVDALASGGYLIATAADKIFTNKDTITGSIGVIMGGFGFTEAIQKLGITRRVFTAGNNKDRLDPFKPITPQDVTKIKSLLTMAHQNFINDVLQGRKGKLRGDKNELFSGDFWTGERAQQLGLIDGTGNLWVILKSQFGVSHYKNYSLRPSLIDVIFKGVNSRLNIPGLSSHSNGGVQAILPGA